MIAAEKSRLGTTPAPPGYITAHLHYLQAQLQALEEQGLFVIHTAGGYRALRKALQSMTPEAVTEEVKSFDSDYYAYDEHEAIDYDATHLQEHFEALVPLGYENDCGGFGDVVLDVAARKISVERNDRFEDYTTTTYEV